MAVANRVGCYEQVNRLGTPCWSPLATHFDLVLISACPVSAPQVAALRQNAAMAANLPEFAESGASTDGADLRLSRSARKTAEQLAALGQHEAALRGALAALDSADSALGIAQARFASLINAVPDLVTVLTTDGTVVEANLAACEQLGLRRDQLIGSSVYALNPSLPADRIAYVIATNPVGRSFVHTTSNRRADGTEFPVEVHSCVFISEGQTQIIAVARDISHRVDADHELRASEQRYRRLLQAMDKGVLIHDAQGHVISLNPSASRIAGMSSEELIAALDDRNRWDLLNAEGEVIPHNQVPHLRALREARTIDSTVIGVYLKNEARHIWLDVTSTPQFREGESTPFQAITTFSDVSELTRDRELFRQTQSLARIGGWDWDPVRQTMHWTPTMREILGVDANAKVNLPRLLASTRPRDRIGIEIAFEDAANLGTGFNFEYRLATPAGERRWVRLIGGARHRDGQVFRVSGTLQDITPEKLAAQELQRRALSDPLTGLPNRDALLAEIAQALEQPRLDSAPSVLHVDLDRFKVVNDLLGHQAGDHLLRQAGVRLSHALEGLGKVARFGADEFLLLVYAGGKSQAIEVAERITRAFARPFAYEREEFVITSSLGLASYPDDGTTVQQLLQSADVALHEAKRRGRNTWQAFDPALADRVSRRLLIETQLRRALENNELRLLYQPQVELSTGRLIAVEALLRWRNRLLGEVPPDEFVPYAETTGDIVRIGAWVLDEACRQLASWRSEGVIVERVAVNVSVRQLLNEDFDALVAATLARHLLPASALEVEITERVVIDEAPEALRTLRALKARGVLITIDDFGEGYSAMSYLRRLPLDCLKISITFMRGIPHDPADIAICQSILLIAASLGLQVVGEGVELVQQRDFLLDHGAEIAQGYLFSKPVSAEAIAQYLPPAVAEGSV